MGYRTVSIQNLLGDGRDAGSFGTPDQVTSTADAAKAVWCFDDLTIAAGVSLRLRNLPYLLIHCRGTLTINGTLDANGCSYIGYYGGAHRLATGSFGAPFGAPPSMDWMKYGNAEAADPTRFFPIAGGNGTNADGTGWIAPNCEVSIGNGTAWPMPYSGPSGGLIPGVDLLDYVGPGKLWRYAAGGGGGGGPAVDGGGVGGGCIIIAARRVVFGVNGSIQAKGTAGSADGAGGGGGGYVEISAVEPLESEVLANQVIVTGGAGMGAGQAGMDGLKAFYRIGA